MTAPTPLRMTPSEALVETLAVNGGTEVFGIVGSAYMDALDIFPAAGIRFIPVAHEQGAAHMADGYARGTYNVSEETKTQVLDLGRKLKAQQEALEQVSDQVDRLQQELITKRITRRGPCVPNALKEEQFDSCRIS